MKKWNKNVNVLWASSTTHEEAWYHSKVDYDKLKIYVINTKATTLR